MATAEAPQRTVRLVVSGAASEGRGHIARALALAEGLRERSLAVELVLLRGSLTDQERARACGLGGAGLTRDVGRPASVVVVDLPDPNEATGGTEGARLVVFDDRDWFTGQADIVVQPSLPTWSGTGSADLVLAGYAFIPLACRIRKLAATGAAIRGDAPPFDRNGPSGGGNGRPPASILVCFGGSDPHGVTGRLARALTDGPWEATFIVGAGYAGPTFDSPVAPIRDPTDLADRLARCDVAVLGAGTMKFEAACLGRPAVLLAAADDQIAIGAVYAQTGAAVWLGDGRTIDPSAVRDAVAALVVDEERRRAMAARGRALIDGRGALRLADAIARLAALDGG